MDLTIGDCMLRSYVLNVLIAIVTITLAILGLVTNDYYVVEALESYRNTAFANLAIGVIVIVLSIAGMIASQTVRIGDFKILGCLAILSAIFFVVLVCIGGTSILVNVEYSDLLKEIAVRRCVERNTFPETVVNPIFEECQKPFTNYVTLGGCVNIVMAIKYLLDFYILTQLANRPTRSLSDTLADHRLVYANERIQRPRENQAQIERIAKIKRDLAKTLLLDIEGEINDGDVRPTA